MESSTTALDRVCVGDLQIQGENEMEPKDSFKIPQNCHLKGRWVFKEEVLNPSLKLQVGRPLALSMLIGSWEFPVFSNLLTRSVLIDFC